MVFNQFVRERDYNSFPVSLTGVIVEFTLRCAIAYWTLGLHQHGLHPNFFEVSLGSNRYIRDIRDGQIDRVIPAVATFEVNLGFSGIGRNRKRQTFTDQL